MRGSHAFTLFSTLMCFDLYTSQVASQSSGNSSLVLLQIVYRHGDRTPIATFKKDPHQIPTWKEGPGQLTKLGCMQHYKLGTYLRQRYADYITGNPHELTVWSSAKDRCLMSASCHLAGMYVPSPDWVWDKDLLWQPVPVQTRPIYDDGMLVPGDCHCPEASTEYERFKNSPRGQEFLRNHHSLYVNLSELTGETVDGWDKAAQIYDALLIEKIHNYSVPDWTESYWSRLKEQSDKSFVFYSATPLLKRLRAGLVLANITNYMKQAAVVNSSYDSGEKLKKLYMYSTHDTLVSSLLDALNIFDGKAPLYGSTLLLELHRDGAGGHFVEGYTLNALDMEPKRVSFPGCSAQPCPLDEFLRLASVNIPRDWRKECGLVPFISLSDGALALIIGQSALLAILAFGCTAYCLMQRRKVSKGSVIYSPLPTEFSTR
uniref:Putative lysosomal acid phosphatase n=2 Tax=Ixodes ricinus TaxID=34613 RepID=V5ICJ2_IXORI